SFQPNLAYLDGTWILRKDYAELLSPNGRVALHYLADQVNIVAGADDLVNVTAQVNHAPLDKTNAGADAVSTPGGFAIPVRDQRLYDLAQSGNYDAKLIVLNATKGFRLYTFTFG
ncbi:MAG: thiol-disulfide isomerase, partial [Candidatus Micrarchaeota archaeon]|nr:thiol-disulfide isomerase [Candidatus Micrarchaeota archaeon]